MTRSTPLSVTLSVIEGVSLGRLGNRDAGEQIVAGRLDCG